MFLNSQSQEDLLATLTHFHPDTKKTLQLLQKLKACFGMTSWIKIKGYAVCHLFQILTQGFILTSHMTRYQQIHLFSCFLVQIYNEPIQWKQCTCSWWHAEVQTVRIRMRKKSDLRRYFLGTLSNLLCAPEHDSHFLFFCTEFGKVAFLICTFCANGYNVWIFKTRKILH